MGCVIFSKSCFLHGFVYFSMFFLINLLIFNQENKNLTPPKEHFLPCFLFAKFSEGYAMFAYRTQIFPFSVSHALR